MPKVLILDDDAEFAASAAAIAEQEGYEAMLAADIAQARRLLEASSCDLLLLDVQLPDGCGLDLLAEVDPTRYGRVVVATGQPDMDTAMRAVAESVNEYLVKPLSSQRWLELLHQTQRMQPLASDLQLMHTGMIGRSRAVRETVATLLRVAPSDASVLVTGESGAGKGLAARTLHEASKRSGEFVSIDCGAVPNEVVARELFGSELNGSGRQFSSAFERARNGTLFLDEITEMPPPLQVYVLHAIENANAMHHDADNAPPRIVAATRNDPAQAVVDGQLRQDLYYRLTDIPVRVAPLRECEEDPVLLARVFIDRLNARYGQRKHLARSVERTLLRHLWPGNVRELRSAVQRAYLLDNGNAVAVQPLPVQAESLQETDTSLLFSIGMTFSDIQRRMLLKTLSHFGNDKTATARSLGISVRTVHNQLAKIGRESVPALGE